MIPSSREPPSPEPAHGRSLSKNTRPPALPIPECNTAFCPTPPSLYSFSPQSPVRSSGRLSELSGRFPKPPSGTTINPSATTVVVSQQSPFDGPSAPVHLSLEEEFVARDLHRSLARDSIQNYHWTALCEVEDRSELPPHFEDPRSPGSSQNHASDIRSSILILSSRGSFLSLRESYQSSRASYQYRKRSLSESTIVHNMTTAVHPNISFPGDPTDHGTNGSDYSDDKLKSPNKFTSLFRWGSASEKGSVTTSHSDVAPSPSLSPVSPFDAPSSTSNTKSIPPAIDVTRANAAQSKLLRSDSGISLPPLTHSTYEVIEDEVRAVSADLAASIRREMDLEDLVERLQAEATERGISGRRTSDYFSDAGTPSRISDTDLKDVDVEKLVRKAQQEKAQLRLDMLAKVQEERDKRKAVELHVRELEDIVAKSASHLVPPDALGRIKDFETTLEEAKRKLAEERQMKENYEDLLSALKEELEGNRNERDNLRDEVVPQLRARVEGLETEASDLQKIMYEHSRMQQELSSLKLENSSLAAAIREKGQSSVRQSISEISSGYASPLSPTRRGSGMVSLPLNPKDRESLAERLKDVEAQRDALHLALKGLRERQQYESKKSMERIKALEAAAQEKPRRQGRDKEVSSLRREVDRLRKRADDALEQKLVCERSLGSLKMDLEKAEQETSTLRSLLQQHDDLTAEHEELKASHSWLSRQVSELKQGSENEGSSVSLQTAYRKLKEVHERSLARMDELEANSRMSLMSEREHRLSEANIESQRAINKLQKRLSEAETDRDSALLDAKTSRKRAEALQKSEHIHMKEEHSLASQLRLSSERVEELASQVCSQLASNESLRSRLAECITRGEEDQKMSTRRINDLQDKLRKLEDRVLDAQHQAEEAVAQHEDEIKRIKETHTSQLRRLKASTIKIPLTSPRSTIPSPFLGSPKLEWTSKRISSVNGSSTELLEQRVTELERALSDADNEMAEVVSRMNMAQIEVLELQTERDDAVRQMRRLQIELATQREKYANI